MFIEDYVRSLIMMIKVHPGLALLSLVILCGMVLLLRRRKARVGEYVALGFMYLMFLHWGVSFLGGILVEMDPSERAVIHSFYSGRTEILSEKSYGKFRKQYLSNLSEAQLLELFSSTPRFRPVIDQEMRSRRAAVHVGFINKQIERLKKSPESLVDIAAQPMSPELEEALYQAFQELLSSYGSVPSATPKREIFDKAIAHYLSLIGSDPGVEPPHDLQEVLVQGEVPMYASIVKSIEDAGSQKASDILISVAIDPKAPENTARAAALALLSDKLSSRSAVSVNSIILNGNEVTLFVSRTLGAITAHGARDALMSERINRLAHLIAFRPEAKSTLRQLILEHEHLFGQGSDDAWPLLSLCARIEGCSKQNSREILGILLAQGDSGTLSFASKPTEKGGTPSADLSLAINASLLLALSDRATLPSTLKELGDSRVRQAPDISGVSSEGTRSLRATLVATALLLSNASRELAQLSLSERDRELTAQLSFAALESCRGTSAVAVAVPQGRCPRTSPQTLADFLLIEPFSRAACADGVPALLVASQDARDEYLKLMPSLRDCVKGGGIRGTACLQLFLAITDRDPSGSWRPLFYDLLFSDYPSRDAGSVESIVKTVGKHQDSFPTLWELIKQSPDDLVKGALQSFEKQSTSAE
jgi:hypothetical protein